MEAPVLIIACGALARELAELRRLDGWSAVQIRGLPHRLHDTPRLIPDAVRDVLLEERRRYARVFVAYADCGTYGALDRVLAEFGVERLPGLHCYDVYCGEEVFRSLTEEEPGSFYLTDFLVRHFDRVIRGGLGLDRHPELLPLYFGHYRRLVFLSQSGSAELRRLAMAHARYLGLEFVERHTGLAPLARALSASAGA